jgi:hypothetical protein
VRRVTLLSGVTLLVHEKGMSEFMPMMQKDGVLPLPAYPIDAVSGV